VRPAWLTPVLLVALALVAGAATAAVRGAGGGEPQAPPVSLRAPVTAPQVAPAATVPSLPAPSHRTATRRPRAHHRAAPAAAPQHVPSASHPLGRPNDGRLAGGVQLPASGRDFFTWDFPLAASPSPGWRRWGTDRLVWFVQGVIAAFRARHPGAPRIGIADLSLEHGGPFGPRYGGLGHASHQNGLDADVLYPRRDHAETVAGSPADIDRPLAQALVDTFVAGGAQFVFVGQHTGLKGPPAVVQAIPNHDDHLHVRIPAF
jgi:hypothetical protein